MYLPHHLRTRTGHMLAYLEVEAYGVVLEVPSGSAPHPMLQLGKHGGGRQRRPALHRLRRAWRGGVGAGPERLGQPMC